MIELNNVYNGDCMELIKEIPNNSIDCIVTDPPYEVDYNNKSKQMEKLGKPRAKQIERDNEFIDKIIDYDLLCKEMFRVLKKDAHVYIFCADKQIVKWSNFMHTNGFKLPQVLIWKKDKTTVDMTMGHKFPVNNEIILFFHKGWKRLNGYNIERSQFRSCLNFKSDGKTDLHSCSKPENLINFLIKLSSKENDIILDMFMGSGTTAYCSKHLNRQYIGFEISQKYYETCLERLRQNKLEAWFE